MGDNVWTQLLARRALSMTHRDYDPAFWDIYPSMSRLQVLHKHQGVDLRGEVWLFWDK